MVVTGVRATLKAGVAVARAAKARTKAAVRENILVEVLRRVWELG